MFSRLGLGLRFGRVPAYRLCLRTFASKLPTPKAVSKKNLRPAGLEPPTSTKGNELLSNDLGGRLPKLNLHKDAAPTLIPKSDTPRVGPGLSFVQLVERLQHGGPKLLYMAESHRLYFVACFGFAFIAAYNLFDMFDLVLPSAIEAYKEDTTGQPMENLGTLVKRFGLVGLMSTAYIVTSLFFTVLPFRLVRRIEYIPEMQLCRLVTHPWRPGAASPVIQIPVADLSIGKTTKVWTGDGFYGATSRSSFFFFLWEKGRRLPWIVDRSGWFWGDARVYDVMFGKEPVALAEKGLSYDSMLKRQQLAAERKKADLRRELGPAWQVKAMGKLMQEDVHKIASAGEKAVWALRAGRSTKSAAALKSPNQKAPEQAAESASKGVNGTNSEKPETPDKAKTAKRDSSKADGANTHL